MQPPIHTIDQRSMLARPHMVRGQPDAELMHRYHAAATKQAPPAPAEKSQCVKGKLYMVKGACKRWDGKQWRKVCEAAACTRLAVGATVLCKAHGGGKRCEYKHGCQKSAVDATRFCKAHGGGKRCKHQGCEKSAVGRTPFCKGHGGGRRCGHEGCAKSAVGSTKFCIAHGGGKRCATAGCTKSARGSTDHCISHGGGKRCAAASCKRSARGNSRFCNGHREEPPPLRYPPVPYSFQQVSHRQHSMASLPPAPQQRRHSLSQLLRLTAPEGLDGRRPSLSDAQHLDLFEPGELYPGADLDGGQPALLTPRPGKRKLSELFLNFHHAPPFAEPLGQEDRAAPQGRPPALHSRQASEEVMANLVVPMEMANYYVEAHDLDAAGHHHAPLKLEHGDAAHLNMPQKISAGQSANDVFGGDLVHPGSGAGAADLVKH